MEQWEKDGAKKRILGILTNEPLSPRQICGRCTDAGMFFTQDELAGLLGELITENKVGVAKFGTSYLPQIEKGPNGILEAFFQTN